MKNPEFSVMENSGFFMPITVYFDQNSCFILRGPPHFKRIK
jgi:hypothetical protein